MFEQALFLAAGLATGFAIGFAIAWTTGAKAREELAALDARAEEQERAAADKLAYVTNMRRELADAFKALSAQALDSTSATFLKLAKAELGQFQERAQGDLNERKREVDALVQPIKESLTKVDGKIEQLERNRLNAYSSLNEQLRSLVETHLPQLRSETANLVKALRQPTVRGRWGELQLKRVVELAGMLEHCDFVEQPTACGEDGRQRPDVIVKLPGGRQIVIDAKVPIAAYLDAHEAADDATREVHLQRHAELVRTHATALGRKAYWDTFSPSPDFVIMFLPGEMLYTAALQQDAGLIEAVTSEKVVLATPGSLIALLRTIALGWREQALALNAQEVAQLGRQLYERVGTLAGYWSDVGDKLEKAVGAYNKSVGALETRVLVTARKFVELKAAASDDGELAPPQPVEALPRPLVAPELVEREAAVAQARERAIRVSVS
ncbi:MAG TPA: DNA recombination protein RmuC [Gammaproteobacteria bacterium]